MKNILMLASLGIFVAFKAFAVPQVLNFSGRLSSDDGDFIGATAITITIYDDEKSFDEAHVIWQETQEVYVDMGRFHMLLGADPSNPLDSEIWAQGELWVGVKVGNAPEMQPRLKVASVPYAIRASDAITLGGRGPESFANADHVHTFASITGVVGETQLPTSVVLEVELTNALQDLNDSLLDALDQGLQNKADLVHGHSISDIAGLQAALDDKASADHNHDSRYVNENEANSVTSEMIVDGTIQFVDIGANGCQLGQVIKKGDSAWICGPDNDTQYAAGAGITLQSGVFSADKTTIEDWAKGVCYDNVDELKNDLSGWDQNALDDLTKTTLFNGDVSGTYDNLALKTGVVNNSTISDTTRYVSVLDSSGVEKFSITDGSMGLSFAGGGATTVSFDPATHRVTITSTDTDSGGTVKSVGLSMPAQFTVTGTPVTDTGILTAAWASQPANTVLAAPNGSNGAPSFRALVAADLPSHTHGAQEITSGVLATDRFSAYEDLVAEGKVGTGASQVAAGNHNHDGTYVKVNSANSVTSGMIVDGTIQFVDIGGNGCQEGHVMKMGTSGWVCGPDNDTQYKPGTGLILQNGIFSVNQTTIEDWAKGVCYDNVDELKNDLSGWDQNALDDLTKTTLFNGDVSGTYDNLVLKTGVVNNSTISDTTRYVSVQDSSGVEKFSITDGSMGLSFAGGGATTVSFDPATHRVIITSTDSGGTVRSVGLSMPAQFTVTGTPVTDAGTLTAAWASQPANTVLAAPNGSSGVPTFRALVAADIPSHSHSAQDLTSGVLPIARGGTNSTATPTAGGVAYGTGTAYAFTSAGSTNHVLKGGAQPTWGTVSLTTDVSGTLPPKYGGTGIDSTLLTGVPTIDSGNWSVTQYLPVTKGGTGMWTAMRGDIIVGSGDNAYTRLGLPATGSYVLVTTGAVGPGVGWGKVDLQVHVTNTLPVANGGTGNSTLGPAGSIPYSNGSYYAFTSVGSSGQYLKSTGAGAPTWGGILSSDIPDLDASKITSGTLSTSRFSAYDDLTAEGKIGPGSTQVARGDHNHDTAYWRLTGNSGTNPTSNYIGTSDNVPLIFKTGNTQVMKLDTWKQVSISPFSFSGSNVIMGAYLNDVGSTVVGATVAGGGIINGISCPNKVTDVFGTVGGGLCNTVGNDSGTVNDALGATISGGYNNIASSAYSFIGGGYTNAVYGESSCIVGGEQNNASGDYAFVGGGYHNQASKNGTTVCGGSGNLANEESAVIAGGYNNTASGAYSTIGGGANNLASGPNSTVSGGANNSAYGTGATISGGEYNLIYGDWAMIPGGYDNKASGAYSFAAGRHATALYEGCFVWGDSTDSDINCGSANRFIVRASGGVYMYTSPSLGSGAYLASGSGSWASLSDRNLKTDIEPVDPNQVLECLSGMPITTWRYMTEESGARHMGPMAQDFFACYGLGESERHITTIDADGVAMAAIQGLNMKVERLERENAELKARVERLERLLEQLTGM